MCCTPHAYTVETFSISLVSNGNLVQSLKVILQTQVLYKVTIKVSLHKIGQKTDFEIVLLYPAYTVHWE